MPVTIETSKEADAIKLVKQGVTEEKAAAAEKLMPGVGSVREEILKGQFTLFSGTVNDDGKITITAKE